MKKILSNLHGGGSIRGSSPAFASHGNNQCSLVRLIVVAAFILCTLAVFAAPAAAWNGGGTVADPYLISSAEDLWQLAENVNAGNTYAGMSFLVTQDIDLGRYASWTPIGIYNSDRYKYPFQGSFDGGSHTISNLAITGAVSYAGLFGYVSNGAVLRNVHLADVDISSSRSDTGGLAGCVYTRASGSVSIANCYSDGSVSSFDGDNVGGLIGSVEAEGSGSVSIQNCYSAGSVSSSDGDNVGGLVGGVEAESSGSVITLENCYSGCSVSASDGDDVGGLAGSVDAGNSSSVRILNCYASGSVSSSSGRQVGGLVGSVEAEDSGSVISIKNSVALNPTVTGLSGVGRVVGLANGYGSVTLTGNYALSTMNAAGAADGLAVTPAEANTQSFYTGKLGWDLTNIWVDAGGYPTLRNGALYTPTTQPTGVQPTTSGPVHPTTLSATPTQTAKSPAPAAGLIAGFGIAAVGFVLRRKD